MDGREDFQEEPGLLTHCTVSSGQGCVELKRNNASGSIPSGIEQTKRTHTHSFFVGQQGIGFTAHIFKGRETVHGFHKRIVFLSAAGLWCCHCGVERLRLCSSTGQAWVEGRISGFVFALEQFSFVFSRAEKMYFVLSGMG